MRVAASPASATIAAVTTASTACCLFFAQAAQPRYALLRIGLGANRLGVLSRHEGLGSGAAYPTGPPLGQQQLFRLLVAVLRTLYGHRRLRLFLVLIFVGTAVLAVTFGVTTLSSRCRCRCATRSASAHGSSPLVWSELRRFKHDWPLLIHVLGRHRHVFQHLGCFPVHVLVACARLHVSHKRLHLKGVPCHHHCRLLVPLKLHALLRQPPPTVEGFTQLVQRVGRDALLQDGGLPEQHLARDLHLHPIFCQHLAHHRRRRLCRCCCFRLFLCFATAGERYCSGSCCFGGGL
mmetsp:Transcript_40724/g.80215  ORF Transcript_40724/g.80215 Transcript_40724/m.80215 type:complete len:292 (-) Transcript_40724:947-1822(-)